MHHISWNRRALGSLLFLGCVFPAQFGNPWDGVALTITILVVLPLMYFDWRAERDRDEEAGRLRLR